MNQETKLHRPESYVLEDAQSSLVWQPSIFPNGSLHLAFSAADFKHECLLSNMQQFEVGEVVMLPVGKAEIVHARIATYDHNRRAFFHVVYETKMADGSDSKYGGARYSEFQLLDWDNYKDPQATDLYRSFKIHYLSTETE